MAFPRPSGEGGQEQKGQEKKQPVLDAVGSFAYYSKLFTSFDPIILCDMPDKKMERFSALSFSLFKSSEGPRTSACTLRRMK